MRTRPTLALVSLALPLGTLALIAGRQAPPFSLECGSLGLPNGQVLIRIPADATGLRVDITTAPAERDTSGDSRTTVRVRAGTDSLSCYSTGPSSFILDLTRVPASTVQLSIAMPQTATFEAKDSRDMPRGSMELAPTASGSFTW